MRWLVLYARSRQVPAALAAAVTGALVVWALARDGGAAPGDPRPAALVLTVAAAAASTGLGGQDPALDRTAAIRWWTRRTAHVLIAGTVACAVLLGLRAVGADQVPTALVVRDAAGLMGLAALGAAVCGAAHAWTLPVGWLALSSFAPPLTGVPMEVVTWMLQPPGTAASTWTALTVTAAGTAAYAVTGPRR
ncbi:hypothetical protein AVW11_14495 [Streptomyces amritsarensis]|uniref:Integral membrane protein n=1 Tax=Streptomyces amritsarensis TaxID=681158 RepID=A0ABX3G542_9ACTN|nr:MULTISPECIES: hypothetical protein [Streptomyces]OLZ67074.1 hypothetical protein AVW11_14495 [Streptomyces amritsarensis]